MSTLDGQTVGWALSDYKYADGKGETRKYRLGDLKYDLKSGDLIDPRPGAKVEEPVPDVPEPAAEPVLAGVEASISEQLSNRGHALSEPAPEPGLEAAEPAEHCREHAMQSPSSVATAPLGLIDSNDSSPSPQGTVECVVQEGFGAPPATEPSSRERAPVILLLD